MSDEQLDITELPTEVVELAKAWASEMMDAGELTYLAATLAAFPWASNPQAFVCEIGAYRGHTTVFMAQVLERLGHHGVPIVSIDPFEQAQGDELNPVGSYSSYLETVTAHGMDKRCFPLVTFSRQAAWVIAPHIGVLVIDGSHRYEDVKSDLELYGPKLCKGGLMFVDDYVPPYRDVMTAVDEWVRDHQDFTIVKKSYFVVIRKL